MISCALSNIRSLIRNCDHLVMNLCQNNYDVVLLTETWLNSKNELDPLLGIASSQYMSVRCDRIFKKGGGILLLMKKYFLFKHVFEESVKDSYEILVCDLTLQLNSVRIVAVYRAPSCNVGMSIQLAKVVSDFCSCGISSIVLGDFNLPDLYKCDSSSIASVFRDTFEAHDLRQLVTESTRGDAFLDLVLCNDQELIHKVSVGPPLGRSDHCTATF